MTPPMTTRPANVPVQSLTNGHNVARSSSKQKAVPNRAKSPMNDADRPVPPRSVVPSQGRLRVAQKPFRGTDAGTKYLHLPESSAGEPLQESEVGPLPPFVSDSRYVY